MAETRNQENASNALNRFGALASDMLSAPLPPDTRVPDVRFMSPGILAGIPDANDADKIRNDVNFRELHSGSNKNNASRKLGSSFQNAHSTSAKISDAESPPHAPASARSSPGSQLSREQLSEVRSRRISQKKPSTAGRERKSTATDEPRKAIEQVIAMNKPRAVWTSVAKMK